MLLNILTHKVSDGIYPQGMHVEILEGNIQLQYTCMFAMVFHSFRDRYLKWGLCESVPSSVQRCQRHPEAKNNATKEAHPYCTYEDNSPINILPLLCIVPNTNRLFDWIMNFNEVKCEKQSHCSLSTTVAKWWNNLKQMVTDCIKIHLERFVMSFYPMQEQIKHFSWNRLCSAR